MSNLRKASLLVIILAFCVSAYFYGAVNDNMASHWNSAGEVDGHMPKLLGLFLMPVLAVLMYVMFIYLPKFDPLGKNVNKFMKYYDGFMLGMVLFLLYMHSLSLAWNLGYVFDMGLFIMPALALLFYYIGVLLTHSERNWFIGIRNPWTLSSDKIWKKTHKLGGKLFKAVSLLLLVGLFFGGYAIVFFVVPLIFVILYLFYYSYREFKHGS